METVICYLLFVIVMLETQKMFFGNCQLSTVTLGVLSTSELRNHGTTELWIYGNTEVLQVAETKIFN